MADPFPDDHTQRTVALVLAGGKGSRLAPLTDARSKPAVPFAGQYRLIDVALSNLANSGLRDVWVVEQYRPFTLNQHLAMGRPWDLDGTRHGLRILPPAEGRSEEGFAAGNGHALHQQVPILQAFGADTVVVCSADHLYQLDLRPALEQHHRLGSELTIVTTEVDEDPSRYGVVQVEGTADERRVTRYDYKPDSPEGNLVATEVFIYSVDALAAATDHLVEQNDDDADEGADREGTSLGDYGETIVPHFVERGRTHEYRHQGYWRDVGTIDAFYRAHMELVEGQGLELGSPGWPLLTNPKPAPPALLGSQSSVSASLVCSGSTIQGEVSQSVIGPGVVVEAGATVHRSVLLGETRVPAGAALDAVIADVGAEIPTGQTGQTKPGPGNITVLVPQDRGPDSDDETTGH